MASYKNEYDKQIARVKRFISNAQKRGYSFDFDLPPKPKRITKASVERIRKITPDLLYSKATYKTADGETLTGTQAREYEKTIRVQKKQDETQGFVRKQLDLQRQARRAEAKRQASRRNLEKARETKIYDATKRTYDAFYERITEWEYGSGGQELNGHVLRQFIDTLTSKYGIEVIAQTVKMLADDGITFGRMEAYNTDAYAQYVHHFLDSLGNVLGENVPFDFYIKIFDGTGYTENPNTDNDDEQDIIKPYG